MSIESKKFNRRDFIKTGTGAIAAVSAVAGSLPLLDGKLNAAGKKTPVVVAHNPKAIDNRNRCNAAEVTSMVDRSLKALTGQNTPADAWGALGLKKNDIVAVKVNCNTWTIKLSPHMELVNALIKSLNTVIPENNIIFYERTTRDLESGGFRYYKGDKQVRYFGNNDGGGYDSKQRLTRIVTDTATKVINLASLKCVEGSFGASLFFKNHIGTLPDSDMSKCHGDQDFLVEVCSRPAIAQKTLLNICDALRGTYRRGVPFYGASIVMGQDTVAAEYAAFDVINQKRKKENISTLDLPPSFRIAQNKYKLGTCTPSKMKIIRI